MNIASTTEYVLGGVDLDTEQEVSGMMQGDSVASIDAVTAKIASDSDSEVYQGGDVILGEVDLDMKIEAESISETPVETEAGQAATSTGGAFGASELSAAKTRGFGQNEFFFGDGTNSAHDFKDGRAVSNPRGNQRICPPTRGAAKEV